MTRNRNHAFLLVLFAFALLAAMTPGTAAAQTPDGETPAVEQVCAEEAGAAFGLCNAYCEAMDCHLADDGDDLTSPSASETACLKVENRYLQITGRELYALQCGPDACPPGTEGCSCAEGEYPCEDELYCDEGDSICVSGGGGDEV